MITMSTVRQREARVRFCVLGSVAVEADRPVGLRGPQLRRLLAALLVDPGHVVSVDRLADIVFDGEPTDAAPTTLRSYVARLRRLLPDDGTGTAIHTEQPGYRLELGNSTLDAHEYERAVDRSRRAADEGRPSEAVELIKRAQQLWRGAAFAEFADEEWARVEAVRLEAIRVDAIELRLSLLVDIGRHDEAIADLTSFVDLHPMRTCACKSFMPRQTNMRTAASSRFINLAISATSKPPNRRSESASARSGASACNLRVTCSISN
jgi:DNA-binding SARP family transcriptional activator